ncbi:tRNA1(Val) (adenine(37)-N6)-methyltransferase [Pararhodonellum marinum]|uniref:tRNA1(Val) (adenine(37)-N6)-methyltransferase n=1 Tax=Pararhodonellum marinum TaxID=2755358 RepID=UPI00188E5082|nr:methyltransferase [Pararhodonellum marinum]
MKNPYFHFKQFSIRQDQCAMKVSTDGVILGALAGKGQPKTILDIGTGTGLLALMMAQRFAKAQITALEIDEKAILQARSNVEVSSFMDKIAIVGMSFQDYKKQVLHKFDLIITNPPYYSSHLKSGNEQKDLAMHNDSLPFQELIKGVTELLHPEGEFWVILPPKEMRELERLAAFFHLWPLTCIQVSDKPSTKVIREVYCFSFQKKEPRKGIIHIKNEEGAYAEVYRNLLRDFLTIF